MSHSSGDWEVLDQSTSRSCVLWKLPSGSDMTVVSLCHHEAKRDKGALYGLFYKGTNPIHESSILMAWSPSKVTTS